MKKIMFIIVLLLCCSGCAKTITFQERSESEIYLVNPLPVSLDEKLSTLVEQTSWGDVATLEVYKLLKNVFTGDESVRWHLEYVDSTIDTTASDVMIIGIRWDTRFTLAVKLTDKQKSKHEIYDVVGYGKTYGDIFESAPQAVEEATLRLYRRVAAKVESSD